MKTSVESLRGVVVGLGSIGNRHLQNLLDFGVGDVTVVRRAGSTNTQFSAPGNVKVCHSLTEVLAKRPDFAIVCNPSHLHTATAIECLQANTHVLIEKPLAVSIGDREQELVKIADESDRVCAMAYCMRYHPAYRLAYEHVRSGKIGRCLYAKAWFEGYLPDWHPWEDYRQSYAALPAQGGGVLRTLDHEIDFLNWVLGPANESIGRRHNTGGIEIQSDDVASIVSIHSTGVMSQTLVSFCRKPASRGFEFVGDEATLVFCMESGELTHVDHAANRKTLLTCTSIDVQHMYVDMMRDFLATIISGEQPAQLADLQDGCVSMKAIDQIDPLPTKAIS